jgi:hypothetical protein
MMTVDVLACAENIVFRARLEILQEEALARLRTERGLAWTALWPSSEAIQVVTLDGTHIGRIRLEDARFDPERWIAVPLGRRRARGPYRSAPAAAQSLAHQSSTHERI